MMRTIGLLVLISILSTQPTHAGYKDWSKEKQVGFVVGFADLCSYFENMYIDSSVTKNIKLPEDLV